MKTDEKKKLYFCKNKIAWCQIDNVRDNMFEMVEHMKKDDGALDMDITSIIDKIKKEQNKPVKSGSRPESSGLGLFIAQNFANKMGGKIGLVRHRNGNTFFVELNKSEQLSLI